MFYSQFILAKKGPLGKIWLAAHLDKKLTKTQIAQTDIKASVESIMAPAIPIALRLSGHLLLGVCRIYSRKVFYLYNESNEALVKTKMSFRPGIVDLPEDQQTAQYNSITLAENPAADDLDLPPIPTQGEMALEEIVTDGDADEVELARKDSSSSISFNARKQDITLSDEDGGLAQFGAPGMEDQDLLDSAAIDGNDWFMPGDPNMSSDDIEKARKDSTSGAAFDFDDVGVSFGGFEDDQLGEGEDREARPSEIPKTDQSDIRLSGISPAPFDDIADAGNDLGFGDDLTIDSHDSVQFSPPAANKPRNTKRRRVQIDDETELSAEHIKNQLKDTTDIVRDFVPAPCSIQELLDRHEGVTAETLKRPLADTSLAPQLLTVFESLIPKALETDEQPDEIDFNVQSEEGSASKKSRRQSVAAAAIDADEETSGFAGEFEQEIEPAFEYYNDGPSFGQSVDGEGHISVQGDDEPEQLLGGLGDENTSQSSSAATEEGDQGVDEGRSGWSKRTTKMIHVLDREFKSAPGKNKRLDFLDMLGNDSNAKTAATTFFELLVLKSNNFINVEQAEPFDTIMIEKTANFVVASA